VTTGAVADGIENREGTGVETYTSNSNSPERPEDLSSPKHDGDRLANPSSG
jgi:hypothetical protein